MYIFPRVFRSNTTETVYLRCDGAADVEIKLQPMEKYLIPHSKMRIDEEERYAFSPMKNEGNGLFSFEYAFQDEQKYSVRIKFDGEITSSSVYALDADLFSLRAFKGDTHVHTCRSDGLKPPFETVCDYLSRGYGFISVTDHHQYAPSLEARDVISPLTDAITVLRGEEVHNAPMGYIHIVSLDADSSIGQVIDNDPDYVDARVNEILSCRSLDGLKHPYTAAYRIFVANEIRRAGGISVLTHPLWDAYGEYNMDTDELVYHLKNKTFDAFELLADDDFYGNGDNLQVALYYELASQGVSTSLLGSSDCHTTEAEYSFFNRHFSLVFSDNVKNLPSAIKNGMCVAVNRRSDSDFFVFGDFRLVKYARFLLTAYYPQYSALTSRLSEILLREKRRTEELEGIEDSIRELNNKFFHP